MEIRRYHLPMRREGFDPSVLMFDRPKTVSTRSLWLANVETLREILRSPQKAVYQGLVLVPHAACAGIDMGAILFRRLRSVSGRPMSADLVPFLLWLEGCVCR
jgi:hypothetical protein